MEHVTQPRPRVKPGRTVRLAVVGSDVNPFAIVVIATGKAEDTYHVRRIASDFGTAYEVEKVVPEGETYHVNLTPDGGGCCECMGFLKWGHCKHRDGLATLRAAGKL